MSDTPEAGYMDEHPRMALIEQYPALRWFATDHLRDDLKPVVGEFARLAFRTASHSMRSPEVSVTIRKLVEAMDAAVRAHILTVEHQAVKEEA